MVLFFSRSLSERWPRNFSIYLCPLPFWLTLPWWVDLSTSWCCLSRLCVVFHACMCIIHALSLYPGNSLVSSWCDHSKLASLLWQCLVVPSLLQLSWGFTHLIWPCFILTEFAVIGRNHGKLGPALRRRPISVQWGQMRWDDSYKRSFRFKACFKSQNRYQTHSARRCSVVSHTINIWRHWKTAYFKKCRSLIFDSEK